MADLEKLVAEIAALSPNERRRLQRRLHATGVFVPEELLSDRNKVLRAISVQGEPKSAAAQGAGLAASQPQPAAAPTAAAPQERPRTGKPNAEKPNAEKPSAADAPAQDAPPPPARNFIPAAPANARAGKVVIGAPAPQHETDPHQMAPLPGAPPEGPIAVVFDGGSRGNPGEGYGSYQVRWPGNPPQVVRLNFGNNYTNNEAEYDTLIAALESIGKRLRDQAVDPALVRLDLRGDSLLVVNQVTGVWKVKDARMESRRDRIRSLLRSFAGWTLTHHDRSNSVRELGH